MILWPALFGLMAGCTSLELLELSESGIPGASVSEVNCIAALRHNRLPRRGKNGKNAAQSLAKRENEAFAR
jgi:hypothetical protein